MKNGWRGRIPAHRRKDAWETVSVSPASREMRERRYRRRLSPRDTIDRGLLVDRLARAFKDDEKIAVGRPTGFSVRYGRITCCCVYPANQPVGG